jgi:uncharacterized protein YbjT (DUF2867 family)
MQVWVAGSTGLVGRSVVELVLAEPRAELVHALVRRPHWSPRPKLVEHVVDFDQLQVDLKGRAASHVYCCLGTTMAQAKTREAFRKVDYEYPLALARAAREAGARVFILVSALGANAKSAVFYNRVKGELEAALADVGFPTLHIARPSLLLGERSESRFGERLGAAVARPLGRLLLGSWRKYAPIAGSDVARALVLLGRDAREGRFVHESDALARLANDFEAEKLRRSPD